MIMVTANPVHCAMFFGIPASAIPREDGNAGTAKAKHMLNKWLIS
jgi:hypothetical protein